MICKYCGNEIADNSMFCTYCGKSLQVQENVYGQYGNLQTQQAQMQQEQMQQEQWQQEQQAQMQQPQQAQWQQEQQAQWQQEQQAQWQQPQQPQQPLGNYQSMASKPKKGLSTGAIVGIVVGIVGFLIVVLLCALFLFGNICKNILHMNKESEVGYGTEKEVESQWDETEDYYKETEQSEVEQKDSQLEETQETQVESEKTELEKAILEYEEAFEYRQSYDTYPDFVKTTMLYLNSDDIPECVIWYNPYVSYDGTEVYGYMQLEILSYQNGKVNSYISSPAGCESIFFFKERTGEFCIEEILGLRSATWWEMCYLSTDFTKIGEASMDNDMDVFYYTVNDNDMYPDEWQQYMNSFSYDKKLTGGDYCESVQSAYARLTSHGVGSNVDGLLGEREISVNLEYVLPNSDSQYLTMEDLEGLTKEECRIARNEIFARHGRMFADEALQSYFNSCSWYEGTIPADEFDDTDLNEYEEKNRDLIVEYEKKMGWR